MRIVVNGIIYYLIFDIYYDLILWFNIYRILLFIIYYLLLFWGKKLIIIIKIINIYDLMDNRIILGFIIN